MAFDIDTKQSTPLFVKPMGNRHTTDKFFILLLPLNVLLCLGIGAIAFQKEKVASKIGFIFTWYLLRDVVYGVIVTIVIILSIAVLNKLKANWLVFAVSFSIVLAILTNIAYIFWLLLTLPELEFHWLVFLTSGVCITYLIYNVNIFICTREFGVANLGPTIKEPIQAIIRSCTVSLFSLVIILLVTIAFTIMYPVAIAAIDIYIRASYAPTIIIRMGFFTFILGGTYIIDFIWNYGFIVMGDYFANYYGRHNVSKTYIFQSIATVSRYHLGTVAFLSTPIFPRLCAAIMAFKNMKEPGKQSDYKLINFISKMSLIMSMPEYALIQTSIFGSKSLKSINQMVELRHKNSLLFLTINSASLKILDLSMPTVMLIGWCIIQYLGIMDFAINPSLITSSKDFGIQIMIAILTMIFVTWFYLNSINMLLLRPAACTFAIHQMIYNQHEPKTSGELTEI